MKRKPFALLREAAHEVADTIGASLDETCTISGEGYEFERYAFKMHCNGITFELSISGDDIDQYFRDAP